MTDRTTSSTGHLRHGRARGLALTLAVLVLAGWSPVTAEIVGQDFPESFSVCEAPEGAGAAPRPECQGGDLRFQAATSGPSRFGFASASGDLNGDGRDDLVVGDPGTERVYVFFGRPSAVAAYGLDPSDVGDREVSAEADADLMLDPTGPAGSFGFSVAVGRELVEDACGTDRDAAPLLIGAPGNPGTTGNGPGTVFYMPAGTLCQTATNPASPTVVAPLAAGGLAVRAPIVEDDDEFGYTVALGRLIATTGPGENLIVGARLAGGGAGKVWVFPVVGGVVATGISEVVEIAGQAGEGLGESLTAGDLDGDADDEQELHGESDDLAAGGVTAAAGKVLVVLGPLQPSGGPDADGVFDETDPRIKPVVGEQDGEFFGFSVAISDDSKLAVGAIFADNVPPDGSEGGDGLTNVDNGLRIRAGKAYVWESGSFDLDIPQFQANTADLVLVGRRSGDQLGFAVAFDNVDDSQLDDLIVSARREDGRALTVDQIDQGTLYVLFDESDPLSPVDLGQCVPSSDCTGVNDVDVLIFGGDRQNGQPDELGFALATGDLNDDGTPDLFASSLTHRRVYAVTLDDTDEDRQTEGRNIRDDDDDGDPDSTDCGAQNPAIHAAATEVPCNTVDENCNPADDRPDRDADGFNACGAMGVAPDCNDNDPTSFPGGTEVCDGNDNDCTGSVPFNERDIDNDTWVSCTGWNDTQGDQPTVVGGGDCEPSRADIFPGAAPNDNPTACLQDTDNDGWGDSTPPPNVGAGTDCNDDVATTFPGAAENEPGLACKADADQDGYGASMVSGSVVAGTDCNDTDATTFPGAAEVCDGNDNDCSGMIADNERDLDNDGRVACTPWNDTQGNNPTIVGGGDCAPMDSTTFPGSAPLEAAATACMKDADNDNWGDLAPPMGVVAGTDCDDASPVTFPGAAAIDAPLNCMKDADNDEYGDDQVSLPVVPGSDCNDVNASVFSGAVETPDDGIDQNCNGSDTITCFEDGDGDGFGSTVVLLAADGDCADAGESAVSTDCDDDDGAIFPGQAEVADDDVDQDCNGADTITCFADADGDGAGGLPPATALADDGSCDAAEHEAVGANDCDDDDPFTFPGAVERCDGNPNTCVGPVPASELDGDGDGWVACAGWNDNQGDNAGIAGGGDCNDQSTTTFPGAAPRETTPTACMRDRDGDEYGDIAPPQGVTPGTDCDDASPTASSTFPGAASADGPLNCMKDADGDERGDAAVGLPIVAGSDCNDADPMTFGGATERCDGNANACNGGVPAGELDPDGDGWVACSGWDDTQGDDPGILGGGDCAATDPLTFPGAAEFESFPGACRKDHDLDGYGAIAPGPGITAGADCDDDSPTAASTFPGAAAIDGPLNCMRDVDDDDYGDASALLPVVRGGDCDDGDDQVNPGVTEGPQGAPICSDGADNDCDGQADGADPVCAGTAPSCPDADSDSFADCSDANCDDAGLVCGDCDDAAASVNPGVAEVCDNADNDCSGGIDEPFDQDGDTFTTCDLPVADCNDTNGAINPAAVEVCNDSVDNDCNAGTLDLFDGDGDGAACDLDCNDANPALNLADGDSDGVTTCAGDCNDASAAISPSNSELCADGLDNDCNAATPDVFDADGDGDACNVDCNDNDPGANLDDVDDDTFTSCAGDCNDLDPDIHPGATEPCDGIDNDCDGTVDEAFDVDGDGFSTCSLPAPDCNDSNPNINPGESEVCNDTLDNDCNAGTPDVFDADGDSSSCVFDCDDGDPNTFPGAMERCDGNNNDCSAGVPANEIDQDGDDWVACSGWNDTQGDQPAILGGGDCAATDPAAFPGAAVNEGLPMACTLDADGDGWGDQTPPPGVTAGSDCDDDSSVTFPGAAEIDGPLNCMKDADGDGYGDDSVSLPVVPGTDCDDAFVAVNPGVTEGPVGDPTCSDTLDNDCDTTIDVADPGCAGPSSRRAVRGERVPGPGSRRKVPGTGDGRRERR